MKWLICGSGPTLEDADFDNLPTNRIAVNGSGSIVPDCDIISVIDDTTYIPHIEAMIGDKLRIITEFTLKVAEARETKLGDFVLVDSNGGGSKGAAVVYAVEHGATEIIFYGIGGNGYCKELSHHESKAKLGACEETYSNQRKTWTNYAESKGVKLDIR